MHFKFERKIFFFSFHILADTGQFLYPSLFYQVLLDLAEVYQPNRKIIYPCLSLDQTGQY